MVRKSYENDLAKKRYDKYLLPYDWEKDNTYIKNETCGIHNRLPPDRYWPSSNTLFLNEQIKRNCV